MISSKTSNNEQAPRANIDKRIYSLLPPNIMRVPRVNVTTPPYHTTSPQQLVHITPTPLIQPQPRRSNCVQNKPTLHMGIFLKQIYMQENYDLPKLYCNAIIDPISGKSLEYRHLIKNKTTKKILNTSFANKLDRLANGVGNIRVKGTNTIKFIPKNKVPFERKVTHGRIMVDFRPLKSEPNCTRLK